jgi:hypothetical protein
MLKIITKVKIMLIILFVMLFSSLPIYRLFNDRRHHRLTALLQSCCALFAHIQILADQKTAVAHQPLADGAVVHMLRRTADGRIPGISALLLVQRIKNDLLAGIRCLYAGFCKPSGSVSVFLPTTVTDNTEKKYLPCRYVF